MAAQAQVLPRRVLLVIDASTRRVVATRALFPADLNPDTMLAEYMAYQTTVLAPKPPPSLQILTHRACGLVQVQLATGTPQIPAEPFALRTHGESYEGGGAPLCPGIL